MKCRRCGFENVDNADFCCHCGEDLRQMNRLEYQNNLRDPNEQMNQNYQQNFNYQQNQSFRQISGTRGRASGTFRRRTGGLRDPYGRNCVKRRGRTQCIH